MLKKLTFVLVLLSLCAGRAAFAQEGCPPTPEHVEATPGPTPIPKPKDWTPGSGIGVVLDPDGTQATEDGHLKFDGRMLSPQDQTVPESQQKMPSVKVGSVLTCAVESASDFDHWVQDDNDNDDCTKSPSKDELEGVTYTWSGPGTFQDVHSLSTTWTAPPQQGRYELTCTMDDANTPVNAPETGNRDDGEHAVHCTVSVYSLSVKFVEDEVAAGAVGNSGHQSGFDVIASDGQGALPDVEVSAPEITDGGLGPYDSITASISMDSTKTDSNGKAHGTFTSGNRTQNTEISVYNTSHQDKSSDSINQVWNSESSPWSYDPYFDYDVSSTIAYKMSYSRGPIVGHAMNMVNTAVSGWELVPASYDWDGDGILDDTYWAETFTSEDEDSSGWDAYNGLSSWSTVNESSDGIYEADQTIWWSDDFIMNDVSFDIVDDNTFDAQ